jgi:hypothetical protein
VNIKLATATLGAALLLAGSPAFASAADMQAGPIHIQNVQIYGQVLSYDENDIVPVSAAITFKNEYNAPATDIVFALQSNGVVVRSFHDVGTFSKGVTIKHRFPDNQAGGDQRVAVAHATFADGTVWSSSEVSVGPAPTSSVGVPATFMF